MVPCAGTGKRGWGRADEVMAAGVEIRMGLGMIPRGPERSRSVRAAVQFRRTAATLFPACACNRGVLTGRGVGAFSTRRSPRLPREVVKDIEPVCGAVAPLKDSPPNVSAAKGQSDWAGRPKRFWLKDTG